MRKLSLFLSVLISFSALVSFTHASSGDITIGNKTYTKEQAQKQIVEPLMQRIQKQKIVKTKSRLIALTIRQYTNKKKSAEKQGKTELVQFYAELLSTLGNLQKVTPTLATSGASTQTQSPGVNGNTSGNTSTTVTNGNVTNNGNGYGGPNNTTIQTGVIGTAEQQEAFAIRDEVNRMWRDGEENQSKSRFIEWIIEQYGADTYAVQYANTLPFNKP